MYNHHISMPSPQSQTLYLKYLHFNILELNYLLLSKSIKNNLILTKCWDKKEKNDSISELYPFNTKCYYKPIMMN